MNTTSNKTDVETRVIELEEEMTARMSLLMQESQKSAEIAKELINVHSDYVLTFMQYAKYIDFLRTRWHDCANPIVQNV